MLSSFRGPLYYGSELADWLWLHENERSFFYATEPVKGRVSEDEQSSCDQQIELFIDGGETKVYGFKQDIPDHPMGSGVDSLRRGRVLRVPPGEWTSLPRFANEVPTHAIVGSLAPNIGASILPLTVSPPIWWLENYLLDACGLSFHDVFPDDGDDIPTVNASDGVVAVGSQRDGIGVGSDQTTYIVGVDHLNVTESTRVAEEVKGLLEGDMRRFTTPGQ